MSGPRLTAEELAEAMTVAREAEMVAERLGRNPENSQYSIHPYGSLDMVDLLGRALLDAREEIAALEEKAAADREHYQRAVDRGGRQ